MGTESTTPPHYGQRIARRAVKTFLFAGGVAGLLLIGGYVLVALHYALELAIRVRLMFGIHVPPGHPDITSIAVMSALLGIPVLVVLIIYAKYRNLWHRRVLKVWGSRSLARKHSRLPKLTQKNPAAARKRQRVYLSDLAGSDFWKQELASVPTEECESDTNDKNQELAERFLRSCEKDISARAIATGLAVGISPNKILDQFTIILASLELQLHVLAKLGRKPTLRTWYQLIVRAGTSIFANNYLNREDAFQLQYATKGIATGLSAAGDAMEDLEFDEAFDAVKDYLGEFANGEISGGIVNTFLTGVEFSVEGAMSIGASGLNLVSNLIEKTGDELFQGIVSGGMLYYHGMVLAADSLSLDYTHRHSKTMTRSPIACMFYVARSAGQLALDYVRKRRKLLRDKKRAALNKVPGAKPVIDTTTKVGGAVLKGVGKTMQGVGKATKFVASAPDKMAKGVGKATKNFGSKTEKAAGENSNSVISTDEITADMLW